MINLMATKTTPTEVDLQPYLNQIFYRQLVDALQYLTIIRLDLVSLLNKLCQYIHNPINLHFQQLKQVLRYIKAMFDYGLLVQPQVSLSLLIVIMIWSKTKLTANRQLVIVFFLDLFLSLGLPKSNPLLHDYQRRMNIGHLLLRQLKYHNFKFLYLHPLLYYVTIP